MNLIIQIYLAYEETSDEFNKLINSISDVLEEYGYSNDDVDPDAAARSLIVVKENTEDDITIIVKDSLMVIIPTESEKVNE